MDKKYDKRWYVGIIIIVLIVLLILYFYSSSLPFSNSPLLYSKKEYYKSAEYPSIAENLSQDPNVVEINLTTGDNQVEILDDGTNLYNYNKSFPGPLIEAKKGDTLVVNFFNDLSEDSYIIWHGLKYEQEITSGRSITYKFNLDRAGLYHYRSHCRTQVNMGLFGVLLVKDYDEDEKYNMPAEEKVLAFSDIKLNENNQVDVAFSSIPKEKMYQHVNGILGNVILTNGVYDGHLTLTRNVPTRLYMVNSATDRFMKISLEGHDMLRIGGDQGLLDRPILIKEKNGLILTTGERAEIVFVPRKGKIRLFTETNVRGIQSVVNGEGDSFELSDEIDTESEKIVLVTFETEIEKREIGDDDEELKVPLKLKKVKKINTEGCEKIEIDFLNMSREIKRVKGTYVLEVKNDSVLCNNFYLHGFTFQHIDTVFLGKKAKIVVNKLVEDKDTIYIPAKSIVRLAVKFSDQKSSFFQSHILTHAELGQQSFLQIVSQIF
jgi:FtsP/CotA-like multicopper oxidase with cupredoxin domain